ncbi:MAG: hypothetical protein AAF518_10100 [Spirochaetota bacterium]
MQTQTKSLQIKGVNLQLYGLGLSDFRYPNKVKTLLSQAKKDALQIVLSHLPDAMYPLRNLSADLLLAGHTHGGQVTIPGFGPIMTLSKIPRSIAAGGHHRKGELEIFVSRGLGMEGHIAPRIRFFCCPQLFLITLLPQN